MKAMILLCAVFCLGALFCTIPVRAHTIPDYEKILVVRMDFENGNYTDTGQEILYGTAPNLPITHGNLQAVVVNSTEKPVLAFSMMEPDLTFSDPPGMGPYSLSKNNVPEDPVKRNTRYSMEITFPYMTDMKTMTCYDKTRNSRMISVDLVPSQVSFCMDYPRDPDCVAFLSRYTSSSGSLPDE